MNKLPKITNFLDFFQYGLLFLVVLIPLADHSRLSIIISKVLPVRVVLGLLFLAGAYLVLRILLKRKDTVVDLIKPLLKDNIFRALAALWLIRAVSIIQTTNLRNSLELLTFFTSMIGLYVLMSQVISKGRLFVFHLTRVYVYVGLVIGFYGLFQYVYFKIGGHALPGVLVGGDYIRLPATFYDANHFAAYLVTVAPMVVAFAWLAKKFWMKAFWWVSYFLLTFVILYTFSRSGLLGILTSSALILGIGLYLGYYRKVLPLLGALLLGGVVVFVSNATGRSLLDRAKSSLDLNEPSTKAHFLLLKGEAELFKENPIFGVGYGSFSEKFRASKTGIEHGVIDKATDIHIPAHSVWFEVITETGLLGLSAYLYFVFTVIGSLTKLIKNSNNKTVKIYSIGFFSAMAGVWAAGTFYSYNLEFFFFFIFLGYLFAKVLNLLTNEGVILADGEKKETLNWKEIVPAGLVILSAGFLVFFKLGDHSLISTESPLAATARELYRGDSLLMPTYLGQVYLAKPPLLYILSTNLMHLYASHPTLMARFIPACFGVISIFFTYLIGRKIGGREVGFGSALLLMLMTPFIYLTRSVNTEIIACGFFLVAVYCVQYAKKYPIVMVISGFLIGLAGLSDLLMTIISVISYYLIVLIFQKDLLKNRKYLLLGLLLSSILILPWHVYAVLFYPNSFFTEYFSRIPNLSALLPLVSLGLVNLLVSVKPKLFEKLSRSINLKREYLVYGSLAILIGVWANLNFVSARISPPDDDKYLAEILLSNDFQVRNKVTLLINGVSPKVTSYYIDTRFKEINNFELEKNLADTGDNLLITSYDKSVLLNKKFARDERGLRTIKQAGMLVLMANY